jgi:hypothetical protein
MQRFCTAHTHRGSSRAWRLVLARHSHDRDAHRRVVDEHHDCPNCLRDTVNALSDAAHGLLLRSAGTVPHMDASGNCTGTSIDWLLDIIDSTLQAEQLDRRDLDRGP